MKDICIYGNWVKVDENNPSFNYHLNQDLPYISVKAITTDGKTIWRENLKVSNLDVAEQQCFEVIEFFNNTRPNDKDLCRKFIGLYKEDSRVAEYEDNQGMSGWLSPNGEFFVCEFGEHGEFVQQFYDQSITPKEETEIMKQGYIRMCYMDRTCGAGVINVESDLTEKQQEWFVMFIDKLTSSQKTIIEYEFKKLGLEIVRTY